MQLYCLPYAGGSALVYARWRRVLPSWIDVRPLEWPGRGARMDEPLPVDPCELAGQLADELVHASLAPRYALFGHSLGAVVAFELAHALLARGAAAPRILFVSGAEAPAVRNGERWRTPLSDEALRDELLGLQGTPQDVLDHPDIMRAALPVLRADFLMSGSYTYRRRRPLPCALQVFAGDQDVPRREALEAWRDETDAGFSVEMLPGHHFFIHARQQQLLGLIEAALSRQVAPSHSLAAADGRP